MSPTTTTERLAWQAYADACLEHDGGHARRAAAELSGLRQIVAAQSTRTRRGGRTLVA